MIETIWENFERPSDFNRCSTPCMFLTEKYLRYGNISPSVQKMYQKMQKGLKFYFLVIFFYFWGPFWKYLKSINISTDVLIHANISKNNNFCHFCLYSGTLKLFGEILKNHQIFHKCSASCIFFHRKS